MDIALSTRLRELRSLKKNTQEQLAGHLGVTAQAVSKWERGEGYPDIAMLPEWKEGEMFSLIPKRSNEED